jgi:hypothetical protein
LESFDERPVPHQVHVIETKRQRPAPRSE